MLSFECENVNSINILLLLTAVVSFFYTVKFFQREKSEAGAEELPVVEQLGGLLLMGVTYFFYARLWGLSRTDLSIRSAVLHFCGSFVAIFPLICAAKVSQWMK
ncbi:hypothetical protein C1752_01323 [Acaryochloris thomasi RCC1774]|uniref:Uncharacterized protein n=2 Tax=Acaryochloris TaxID=155977 RepID=A0A2W1JVB3_9CYAN|nr:hypothetical protein C1752_01323 [Acaryochloris thomasi RCC1774]